MTMLHWPAVTTSVPSRTTSHAPPLMESRMPGAAAQVDELGTSLTNNRSVAAKSKLVVTKATVVAAWAEIVVVVVDVTVAVLTAAVISIKSSAAVPLAVTEE